MTVFRYMLFNYQGLVTATSKMNNLKVPKRENFSLAFFALSEPIEIFYQLTADFDVFWFFAGY